MTKLYRRVKPDQNEEGDCHAAFIPRDVDLDQATGEHELSTFSAAAVTPRDLLERVIVQARTDAASSDPKIKKRGESMLKKTGQSVEEMLERGWSVRVIESESFTSNGFKCGDPDGEGHVSVVGAKAYFEEKAMVLEELSSEVSRIGYAAESSQD